jgi:RNA polymerase sigma factor (sigma-70 family)
VDACLAGNADAWEALLAKYKNLVYSIPIRSGVAPDDANDIFQSVCVELYNGLPALRNVSSLPAWLATVTRHRTFHWRKAASRRTLREGTELDAADASALGVSDVDAIADAQRDQAVRDAVGRLPDRCQRLVRMLFFEAEARPYASIAAELGLAQGSIGFIRGRCLQKLRRELEKRGHR